jgi:GNAT superfamily N-acetyltransferase
MVGLITYHIVNNECEIVSLDSMSENRGIGTMLIEKVTDVAREHGCRRVWLITTNDNTHAIRFYQRRGFNMAALHVNAIEESRKIKPQIPLYGFDGIPIMHEVEFEKIL